MGKFIKAIFAVAMMVLCLCGCSRKNTEPRLRVVSRIDVQCHQGQILLERHYTNPEKMESVLNFLRLQENLGNPVLDPERVIGDVYRIDVGLSDGQHHIYQQRADRFLSKDYHPWQLIDPERGRAFYDLLREMPSD